jgi:hypothetical protein
MGIFDRNNKEAKFPYIVWSIYFGLALSNYFFFNIKLEGPKPLQKILLKKKANKELTNTVCSHTRLLPPTPEY